MTDEQKREILKLMGSGALSGGIVGGVGSLLSGAKSLGTVGKAAGIGSALAGGLAGLSGTVGLGALGSPDPEDGSGYTKRLGLGGALAGGLADAGAGALMAIPGLRKYAASKLGGGLLSKGVSALKGGAPAAAALGAGGALVGGYQAADEGMQMDFLRNLSKKDRERLMAQQYQGDLP